jgi:hypothetical protein
MLLRPRARDVGPAGPGHLRWWGTTGRSVLQPLVLLPLSYPHGQIVQLANHHDASYNSVPAQLELISAHCIGTSWSCSPGLLGHVGLPYRALHWPYSVSLLSSPPGHVVLRTLLRQRSAGIKRRMAPASATDCDASKGLLVLQHGVRQQRNSIHTSHTRAQHGAMCAAQQTAAAVQRKEQRQRTTNLRTSMSPCSRSAQKAPRPLRMRSCS